MDAYMPFMKALCCQCIEASGSDAPKLHIASEIISARAFSPLRKLEFRNYLRYLD
jgi:hypothetical protein